MEKKIIGYLLIIFGIVLAGFTYWITEDIQKLNQYLHKDCNLPANICPFNTLVPTESIFGSLISLAIIAFGIYLVLTDKNEIKSRIVDEKKIKDTISNLSGDEKKIYELIVASDGTAFQSELVEKSVLDKVKVSRILDKMEGRGLIERKRRGMSNVIVLRH